MFNAVAYLFLLVNGVPTDKPIQVGRMPRQFDSLEACQQWQASDSGQLAASMAMISPLVMSGKAIVKFDCVPAEDDSI